MKLIVGLGNPGNEYSKTRHNIGFLVIDNFIKKNNIFNEKKKYDGIYYETYIGNEKVILLKPQKYMNLSGEVIKKFVEYFKIPIKDIFIINDDLDMECGKIRLRLSGSSGGHNGLKNIELHLNTKEYKRLKIGISNNKMYDTKDYVLGRFNDDEYELIEKAVEISSNIIEDFVLLDFDKLMNKYNK